MEVQRWPLLFAELPLEGRIMVLDDILAALTADAARALVAKPAYLGLLCEAHLGSGIEHVEIVAEHLEEDDYRTLAELVDEALLARLPSLV